MQISPTNVLTVGEILLRVLGKLFWLLLHQICKNTVFHRPYSPAIVDYVLIRENTGHWKPVFPYFLFGVWICVSSDQFQVIMYVAKVLQAIWETFLDEHNCKYTENLVKNLLLTICFPFVKFSARWWFYNKKHLF